MKLVVLAGVLAALLSLTLTPLLIRILSRNGHTQAIRESADGLFYPEHGSKRGTPSMGGLAIIGSVAGGYLLTHLIMWQAPTASGLLAIYLTVALGLCGYS